jgi:hypothetical protein
MPELGRGTECVREQNNRASRVNWTNLIILPRVVSAASSSFKWWEVHLSATWQHVKAESGDQREPEANFLWHLPTGRTVVPVCMVSGLNRRWCVARTKTLEGIGSREWPTALCCHMAGKRASYRRANVLHVAFSPLAVQLGSGLLLAGSSQNAALHLGWRAE